MSDEDTRSLLRTAEATNDPDSWLRVGRAFARIRSFDESGHAFARAATVGAAVDEDLDAIAPRVDELRHINVVRSSHESSTWRIGWSAAAHTVIVAGWRQLELVDPESGTREEVDRDRTITTAALDLTSTRLVAARSTLPIGRTISCELVVRDLVTRTERLVGRRHSEIEEVALLGPRQDVVACTYADRILAYRLGATPEEDERILHLTGIHASLARSGHVAVVRGRPTPRTLSLIDPLQRRPRAVMTELGRVDPEFATPQPFWAARQRRLLAVGERAVLVTRSPATATLVGRDARVVRRVEIDADADADVRSAAASPSGRLVALTIGQRGRQRVIVVDFQTGDVRRIELSLSDETVRACAWSPSGRKLAVATASTIFILGAGTP